jgi:hypothetical protein
VFRKMGLKIIDGTPSSISKFIREKEEMKLKKQGAVEELEKLKEELLGKLDYFFDDESLKISNEYIRRRLKELKEGVEK